MSEDIQNYNAGSKVFHWSVALLILGLLIVGFWMGEFDAPFKYEVYGIHKALGMAVLVLGVLRIIWKIVTKSPKSLESHEKWEKVLSKSIHGVLFLLVVAMPLSGWVMSSAGGHPISFFGLFEFPSIVEKNREIGRAANQAHELIAYALLLCVGLHIVGALKHHVIDKDETLKRMGANLVIAILGLVALGAAVSNPVKHFLDDAFATHIEIDDDSHEGSGDDQS